MKYILILILTVTINPVNACDVDKTVKPLVAPTTYPRGYLYKHYTPCRGKWYPKGYKCLSRKKVSK